MAIPVISAATLEYFSLILGEAPLMISGDQNTTATAANPTGLRLAGGNLFRDYTPWAEHEITDWTNGFGHAHIGDNGWWGTDTPSPNTVMNDIRLNRDLQLVDTIAITKPSNIDWTTDPLIESGIVRANDGNYYLFRGFEIQVYDSVNNEWDAWLDVRGTIHSNADADQADYYIIDMCEFDEYLIVVTRPKFRKTEPDSDGGTPGTQMYAGGPYLNEFFMAAHGSGGLFYSMPNVFAVRLSDKFCFVVGGSVSSTNHFSCPLPNSSTYAVPSATWAASSADIGPILCCTTVHQYGGYLFMGGSAGFGYTSGGFYDPGEWVIDGNWISSQIPNPVFSSGFPVRLKTPYDVSTKYGGDNWVTGFAGMRGQVISDTSVYLSTSRSLFLLDLAVPAHVKVWDYSGLNVRNGKGMIAHNNDIYIPVGNGLFRFTLTGQTVPVGVNQTPEPSIYSNLTGVFVYTQHVSLASTPGTLLSSNLRTYDDGELSISGNVIGLRGQGWHQLADITGQLYFRQDLLYMWIVADDLRSSANYNTNIYRVYFADNEADDFALGAGDGYRTTADVRLGFFSADAPLLEKDWQSISVYGRCFSATEGVEVQYQLLDSPVDCQWLIDMDDSAEWTVLGEITEGNDAEFVIPPSLVRI